MCFQIKKIVSNFYEQKNKKIKNNSIKLLIFILFIKRIDIFRFSSSFEMFPLCLINICFGWKGILRNVVLVALDFRFELY